MVIKNKIKTKEAFLENHFIQNRYYENKYVMDEIFDSSLGQAFFEVLVPFSIEMVIWVAVGGRGTLVGAILGAVVINYAKSLVSEALPQSWLFIQGGLLILVVTALPEGVIGWCRGDGPRNWLNRLGIARRSSTYPRLDREGQEEVQP